METCVVHKRVQISPEIVDEQQHVWRCRGEPNIVHEGDRFELGSVMVWGGISSDGRMDLVIVRGNLTFVAYIEQILLQHV